jgi:hypothetical protein
VPFVKKIAPRAALFIIVILFFLAGCENVMQNMYDQPKYKPFERSEFFLDGQSARPRVEHTVAYSSGVFAGASSGRRGLITSVEEDPEQGNIPFFVTSSLLQRGQERYNIYCVPCHGSGGDGDGLVVRHGFPSPPSYHSERLRNIPDVYFYRVITQGFGRMLSYADRVEPEDRWAIVAYIRELQLSRQTPLEDAPVPQTLETE